MFSPYRGQHHGLNHGSQHLRRGPGWRPAPRGQRRCAAATCASLAKAIFWSIAIRADPQRSPTKHRLSIKYRKSRYRSTAAAPHAGKALGEGTCGVGGAGPPGQPVCTRQHAAARQRGEKALLLFRPLLSHIVPQLDEIYSRFGVF